MKRWTGIPGLIVTDIHIQGVKQRYDGLLRTQRQTAHRQGDKQTDGFQCHRLSSGIASGNQKAVMR